MKFTALLIAVLLDVAAVLAAPVGDFARDAANMEITTRDAMGGEFARDDANVFARD
jgi:hypothetical protein